MPGKDVDELPAVPGSGERWGQTVFHCPYRCRRARGPSRLYRGSYVIADSTVTTSLNGTTSSTPYCVQGNTMYLMQAVGDGGGQSSGSIVLVHQ